MPSFSQFLNTWSFEPVSFLVILAFAIAYLILVVRFNRKGGNWPIHRTLAFLVLGLGSFAFIEFGFFGTYRYDLRWAFTTRIALLLYVVPLLIGLGKPIELSRLARGERGRRFIDAFFESWPIRLISNAIFAPLFGLAFFMLFVTPISADLRHSHLAQNAITIGGMLLGQLMLLPMLESKKQRSEIFIAAEFLFAFVELMLDAIPGVVLSISNSVLDGATQAIANAPVWFPTALNDQHFSGNLLWMIAEGADIPILVLLFIRWGHNDKKTAKSIDDLSDEEFEALANQHLKPPRG